MSVALEEYQKRTTDSHYLRPRIRFYSWWIFDLWRILSPAIAFLESDHIIVKCIPSFQKIAARIRGSFRDVQFQLLYAEP